MFDPIPLIIWSLMMIFCIHWLISVIKMKINYEIIAALAVIFYFTASFIGQYFIPLYENLITTIIGLSIIFFGVVIFISQIIIMKRKGKGQNWENTEIFIEKGWFKYMRHPIYFGLAIANIGAIIWIPSFFSITLGIISFIFCLVSSILEDKVNIKKFGKKYESGMFTVGDTILYVNRGIGLDGGIAPRVRFFAKPEITVFDVRPNR